MKYQTFDQKSYKIHTIKTDRFKTSRIEVFFRFKADKEKLPIRSFLSGVLGDSSKDYNTSRKLSIQIENLYKCFYSCQLAKVGGTAAIIFAVDFINPEFIKEKDYINNVVKFLFDMILRPNTNNNEFDLTSFNNIKNDILLDIESISENPGKMAINNALNAMDKDSMSSYLVLGSKEDIEKVTPEALYNEYIKVMNESVVDIFAIGNLNMENITSLIKENYHNNRINSEDFSYSIENKLKKKVKKDFMESSFMQSQLVMLYNTYDLTKDEKELVFPMFNYIFGNGGLTSKLYQYLREKNGLCYRVSSMNFRYDNLLCEAVSLKKENIEKAIKLSSKALKEMQQGDFTDDDIKDAINNLKLSLELGKNSQMGILNNYELKVFNGNYSFDEKLEKIEKITKEDIIKVANKVKLNTIYSLNEGNHEENNN